MTEGAETATSSQAVDAFIDRWQKADGAERANFQSFANELADLLAVNRPNPTESTGGANEYVFERSVQFNHPDGSTSPGFIDLYKKDCFILEAKQSKLAVRGETSDGSQAQLDLPTQSQSKPATLNLGEAATPAVGKPAKLLPSFRDRIRAIRTELFAARAPASRDQVASRFYRANRDTVEDLLETLVEVGQAHRYDGGRYFIPKG